MTASGLTYSVLLFVLLVARLGFAQTVTVRVINSNNRRPLQKQPITFQLLYDKPETVPVGVDRLMRRETDTKGEAQFTVPEPAPEHLAVQIKLTSEHWHCAAGVLVSTKDVIQKGIVESAATSGRSARPLEAKPGEIVFVARPLSLLERLLYPLEKD